jgi:hypothetical protein
MGKRYEGMSKGGRGGYRENSEKKKKRKEGMSLFVLEMNAFACLCLSFSPLH